MVLCYFHCKRHFSKAKRRATGGSLQRHGNKSKCRLCFINGYAFRNPATLSVTLDTAEGALNRVDRVVVRWDLPQRDMYIAVLKGTPSAKPTATAVTRTTEIWELALADIYVGKGVTRIQTQNITDQRFNSAVCGIVTGTVEEIDASVLTKQFTDFFNTYSAAVLDEFSAYKQSMEKYLTEIAGVYDSYVSKTEAYLHSMRASLTKDTAVLKARLTTGTRNF